MAECRHTGLWLGPMLAIGSGLVGLNWQVGNFPGLPLQVIALAMGYSGIAVKGVLTGGAWLYTRCRV